MIRKDRLPNETIQIVKEKLRELDLCVEEKDEFCYEDYWYSLRLEIMDSIGSNGKGISKDYSRASAYAELIERIQGECIFERLFPKKRGIQNNAIEDVSIYVENGFFTYEEIKNLQRLSDVCEVYERKEYVDLFGGKIVSLPEWYIRCTCGTNGLCAGNTAAEAILQGINEIQERYVKKLFFNSDMKTYNIPLAQLQQLDSFKQIKKLEEKGYICNVKDMTLGGKYPVLALVIFNHNKSKYIVSFAADYNMDICLQRCVTEIFQGRHIGLELERQMNRCLDMIGEKKGKKGFISNIIKNTGDYPIKILNQQEASHEYLNAFSGISDNRKLLNYSIKKLELLGQKIYIRDLSKLGFPTYRVYIRGMSELFDNIHIWMNNEELYKRIQKYYSLYKMSRREIVEFSNALNEYKQMINEPIGTHFRAITNLAFSKNEYFFDLENINVLLSLILYREKQYYEAIHWIQNYFTESNQEHIERKYYQYALWLQYLFECQDEQETYIMGKMFCDQEVIDYLWSLKYMKEIEIFLPRCPECGRCPKTEICDFNRVDEKAQRLSDLQVSQEELRRDVKRDEKCK